MFDMLYIFLHVIYLSFRSWNILKNSNFLLSSMSSFPFCIGESSILIFSERYEASF